MPPAPKKKTKYDLMDRNQARKAYQQVFGMGYKPKTGSGLQGQKADLIKALNTGKAYPYTKGPDSNDPRWKLTTFARRPQGSPFERAAKKAKKEPETPDSTMAAPAPHARNHKLSTVLVGKNTFCII